MAISLNKAIFSPATPFPGPILDRERGELVQSPIKLLKNSGEILLKDLTVTMLGLVVFIYITPYLNDIGICLGSVVSERNMEIIKNASALMHVPKILLRNALKIQKGSVADKTVIAAFVEELIYRLGVQELFLKKLPESLTGRVSPFLANAVANNWGARATRVFASALFFALLHTTVLSCEEGGGISQLLAGLLYGAIIESGGSLKMTMTLHLLNNFFASFLS